MIRNFVLETANAPGPGQSIRLAGPKQGRLSWRAVYTDNSPVFWFMDDATQGAWGVGTFHLGTPDTITLDTIIGNTAGTTQRLDFASAVDIYNEIPAERSMYGDNQGIIRGPAGAVLDPIIGGVPIGAGMDFWGSAVPPGWLLAYGQELSRVTYAKLFAAISISAGAGNGSTTFTLPDKRGRVSLGSDFMGGVASGRLTLIGSVPGSVGGDQNLQSHSHGLNWVDPGHAHGVADSGHTHVMVDPTHSHAYVKTTINEGGTLGVAFGSGAFIGLATAPTGGQFAGMTAAGAITGVSLFASATGIVASVQASGGGASQNLPPGIVCNYIIFAGA